LLQYNYKPLSAVWLKASVMGSLWASFEIVIGSFLHNLHIPFSGTFLTLASIFFIIAFIQNWKDTGLVWRAGMVCALMKSISPSAVIIGPMIGIMTEAIMIEIMLRLTGRNALSYLIGGGLAGLSTILHKVISLLILYGMNLVKILEGLYQYAVKQLKIISLEPITLILLLAGIYLLAGMIAGLLGYIYGSKINKRISQQETVEKISLSAGTKSFSVSGRQRYFAALLLLHLMMIVLCMWMINKYAYYYYLPVCSVYLAGCFAWYRNSMRSLKKISFWIHFIIITFLASFMIEAYSTGNYFSSSGLIIGLKMNLRAFVIMAGFTAIATELKNPLIRSLLYNKGFSSVYQSLSLAFSALPAIISGMTNSGNIFKKGNSVMQYLLTRSDSLLEQFTEDYRNKPPVIIITGETGQGKSTFTRTIVNKLTGDGIRVSGFCSRGVHINETRIGFDLEEIRTGNKTILARKTAEAEGWISQGHYYFDPRVFEEKSDLIFREVEAGADLLVIDEVGPLEMNDTGWHSLISRIINEKPLPMIWTVRKRLVGNVARKWNVGDVSVYFLDEDSEDELVSLIKSFTAK